MGVGFISEKCEEVVGLGGEAEMGRAPWRGGAETTAKLTVGVGDVEMQYSV